MQIGQSGDGCPGRAVSWLWAALLSSGLHARDLKLFGSALEQFRARLKAVRARRSGRSVFRQDDPMRKKRLS